MPNLPVAAPDPAAVIKRYLLSTWGNEVRKAEALAALDALLVERQQDKADVELALDGIPDPMHPDLRRWAYKLTDAKVLLAHVAGHDDPGNVEAARAALAVEEDARPTQHVTHGRHCTCSACAREDWTRITGPCGMHGSSCPAVYAPLGGAGDDVPLAAVEEDAPAGKPETPGNSGAAVEEDAE